MAENLRWAERAVGGQRSPFGRRTVDFSDGPLATRDGDDPPEKVVDHQLGSTWPEACRSSRTRTGAGTDNDLDGVLDVDDQRPLDPEDRGEHQDADGCPEPDEDGDGLGDVDDARPTEPETVNGVDDEDGCPDLVRVDRETRPIRILEPVYLAANSDGIQRWSHAMLNEVAAIRPSAAWWARAPGRRRRRGRR